MIKRKDNLTDLIEQLPKVATTNPPKTSKEQQVVNVDGEIVTLGKKPNKTKNNSIYSKFFELSEKDIERIIRTTIDKTTDAMAEQIIDKVEAKLKKRGLI